MPKTFDPGWIRWSALLWIYSHLLPYALPAEWLLSKPHIIESSSCDSEGTPSIPKEYQMIPSRLCRKKLPTWATEGTSSLLLTYHRSNQPQCIYVEVLKWFQFLYPSILRYSTIFLLHSFTYTEDNHKNTFYPYYWAVTLTLVTTTVGPSLRLSVPMSATSCINTTLAKPRQEALRQHQNRPRKN